jgi:putative spermidine/putrescine transport system substrate-binding protein
MRPQSVSYCLVYVLLAIFASFVLSGCSGCKKESDRPKLRLVSWGGKFQQDMIDDWIKPAAEREGIDIQTEAWNGDYEVLTSRIERGLNTWDLVHVEAHYVGHQRRSELFVGFPNRDIPLLSPDLRDPYAVPVLQYAYLLAYRSDKLKTQKQPDWSDFWDTQSFPGLRGLRDFPIGNIEISLVALGRNIDSSLYDTTLTMTALQKTVKEALEKLGRLKPSLVWWQTGDQLQQNLVSGELVMCASWSGRVLSANKEACADRPMDQCLIKANEATALISTDWWVIPVGTKNSSVANRLLESMYSKQSVPNASLFSTHQGYAVPILGLSISDSVAKFYLTMGSSSNGNRITRLSENFWSRNYDWIADVWTKWRLSR